MKSYTASYFKTHFGSVLDRAGMGPVRIQRRGRSDTILIPESKYRELQSSAANRGEQSQCALIRLKNLALGPAAEISGLDSDPRADAILNKHS